MNQHVQPSADRTDADHAIALRYGEERLPRYTSYPTAPQFAPAVDEATYRAWLAALPERASASLYLHVPFCRSMCWYCGCHTTITKHQAPISDYLEVMRREIGLVADALPRRLSVRHVHFGGGTPTILEPAEFIALMGLLRERFALEPDAEVAIEIDPRTLKPAMIAALGEAGVNRASLGVQSFDPVVQRAIARIQTEAQTLAALRGLRDIGVTGVNFDLIYGLPHQTVQSCLDTVARCVAMRPDRFAVFGYAHVPSFKKHQRKISEADLPDTAERHAQAEAIAAALVAAGYRRIGLDHYALPEDAMVKAQEAGELHRNFQGYTTDPADTLIGFGASSIGKLPQGYVQNEVQLPRYAERVAAGELPVAKGYRLTADDRLRADIIERLMCDFAVDLDEVCARHGASAAALLAATPRLAALRDDGVVGLDGARLTVTDARRFLVRTVASCFDAYLGASGRTHSRAV
ncbi:oxygen-independent coproporphyrinogen III oxidase [Alsobacter sp. SYSU M60028]|uniref:Coproporphyrinogen-III oxidase n=1 Tax=Alsobacter ponti TaxID=2962936 RepID=A0ABT1L968_9HYPH|nr:oxygen-independent coproporphyrinogen III oxidase [Alsobacter ponti]MCP8938025.1 oxygen-independent coproporphyrinogen III oxidase [Alsobacter ponti]